MESKKKKWEPNKIRIKTFTIILDCLSVSLVGVFFFNYCYYVYFSFYTFYTFYFSFYTFSFFSFYTFQAFKLTIWGKNNQKNGRRKTEENTK